MAVFPACQTNYITVRGCRHLLLPDAIYLSGRYKLQLLKLPSLSTLILNSSIHKVASFFGFIDNFHMNYLLLLSTLQLPAPLA